ncbi:unnamed protein product [Polarella glacialis]|uniref:Uncharacterized protein n=1 Tax=Polarella glacialis TaxID=89957 RepID=A0A813DRA2_POLGL|nr:unnamed protein product [Polarella glacialis]
MRKTTCSHNAKPLMLDWPCQTTQATHGQKPRFTIQLKDRTRRWQACRISLKPSVGKLPNCTTVSVADDDDNYNDHDDDDHDDDDDDHDNDNDDHDDHDDHDDNDDQDDDDNDNDNEKQQQQQQYVLPMLPRL